MRKGKDGWGGSQLPELGHSPLGGGPAQEFLSGAGVGQVTRGLPGRSLDGGGGAGWSSGCPPSSFRFQPTWEQATPCRLGKDAHGFWNVGQTRWLGARAQDKGAVLERGSQVVRRGSGRGVRQAALPPPQGRGRVGPSPEEV